MALVLAAILYLAVLHRGKQQAPTTFKEGLASVRCFLELGYRPLTQRATPGVCRGCMLGSGGQDVCASCVMG